MTARESNGRAWIPRQPAAARLGNLGYGAIPRQNIHSEQTDPKKRAILAQNPIVAVEAYVLTAGEARPILRRLNSGRYGGYLQDYYYRGETEVKFLLLFDSRNGQLVSNDGVLVVNTPSRGRVGMFGGISALYIGREW